MPLVKVKPTSAGPRKWGKVGHPTVHKGAPMAGLTEKKIRGSGRNNSGHITTRHQGGGHKQHYRIVDFRRNKDGITAKVERVEYDPNRSAHIALLCYADGERRYIVAPKGIVAGARRWRGIRPTVRGVVMNPVDHPHGGGEGRTGTKRDPVSPWGQLTKGYRTRKNKRTDVMIVQRRHRK